MAAQGHKHVLKVHGGHIYIGLEGVLELNSAPPDGCGLVPAHLMGGQHLQPGAYLIYHIRPEM